jgi:hypothetical protein
LNWDKNLNYKRNIMIRISWHYNCHIECRIHDGARNMSGRFKPYLFILLGILLTVILLNAPVAFAFKMPTACNIFNKTQIEKSGPCGHKALFSNDKPFGSDIFLSSGSDFDVSHFLSFHNTFSTLSVPPVSISIPAAPLRC